MMDRKQKERYAIDHDEIVNAHFAKLTKLLQAEEREDRVRFQSEFLDKKPEEREKSGKALLWLALFEMHYNPSGQRLLTFGYASGKPLPRYSLAAGDVVRLSGVQIPENQCPTGTVYEKDRKTITVAFGTQLAGWIGREPTYHLNLSPNLTTYDRMYAAVRETGHAKHCQLAHLRDISLGLKKPRFYDPAKPDQIDFFNKNLNRDQQKAVCLAFEAEDVMLIHGPPGTGKTCVLVELIRQAKKRRETILVSAPSNAACDHVVDCLVQCEVPVTRLGHPARMLDRLREHTFSYKLTRHPLAKLIEENEARLEQLLKQKERRSDRRVMSFEDQNALHDELRALRHDIKELKAQIFQQVWNSSDVVVATHTVCGDPLLKVRNFDWVIIDEATQGTEPGTWIPVSRGGRIILAGDHCQLPPTVFSRKKGPDSLHYTLFERFHDRLGAESKIRLSIQYRMHASIMQFSSREFYDGQLEAHESVREHTLADLAHVTRAELSEKPMVFLDTAGLGYEDAEDPGSASRFNTEEAKLVTYEYFKLLKTGVSPREIAIISPYSAQVKLLVSLLQAKDASGPELAEATEIDSVDAFQGREKEAVIVSLVRSNLKGEMGFLTDTRRMNVAMTRARRKLIVIGDSATISNIPFYQDYIRYVESIDGYLSAWEYVT